MYVNNINQFIRKFGIEGIICTLFYPIINYFITPMNLIITLWNTRVLLKKGTEDYSHFTKESAILSLFYKTQYNELNKYGREGKSYNLSPKGYKLSKFFHLDKISLWMYTKSSNLTLIICMFMWLIGHLIWAIELPILQVITVVALALYSTTFFANMFILQNYNVIGWAFFSILLFALFKEYFMLSAVIMLLISIGSITITGIAMILSVYLSVVNMNIMYLAIIMPTLIKLILHLNDKESIKEVLKHIGLYGDKKTALKRNLPMYFGVVETTFTLLYIQYGIVLYLITGQVYVTFTVSIILYLINMLKYRFADVQTFYMLMFSLATYLTITNFSFWLLLSYWLLVSPPFILFTGIRTKQLTAPILRPVNVKKYIKRANKLLTKVKKHQKVYIPYKNPKGNYNNIFNGQRLENTLLTYIGSIKEFLVFPNEWTIIDKVKAWKGDRIEYKINHIIQPEKCTKLLE